LGLPPEVTASTGLDALTQLIEPFVSIRANPMTDDFCREGLERVRRSIRRAYHHGEELDARTEMAFAALLGGLALANAGLGVVHGFAGPIGGMFPAPHGAVCAALLPHGMDANIRALRLRAAESPALGRYDEIGRILTGRGSARAEDGVQWVSELCNEFRISQLRTYALKDQDVGILVEKAAQASSMKANAITLTAAELSRALRMAL
jgi:alcohol dehydrogenase class IV